MENKVELMLFNKSTENGDEVLKTSMSLLHLYTSNNKC